MTKMLRIAAMLFVLLAGLAAVGTARAQNAIVGLETVVDQGRVSLRVRMRDPLTAVPPNFTIAQPARIAFDFPNTTNALGRNSQEFNQAALNSVSIVEVAGRTRMVLNLGQMSGYDTQVDGKNLVIALGRTVAGTQAGTKTLSTRFAEGTTEGGHAIKTIDFRRGRSGEGRIVVDLSDTNTGIDIRQQGEQLIVEFFKTALPESLRRRMDVLDFGTPVNIINTTSFGDNVRMVIEPKKGNWEYNAYQTDTQFVVEVRTVEADSGRLQAGREYRGDKLSLNFQNIDVRSVLNVIADFTELNIITSDTVQGYLTLRLKDVPWDQALDIILQTRGLDMRRNGNVIWIAPRDELAAKEKLDFEARQQISDLEPLRTESFQLNYSKAETFAKLLTDPAQRILSKRGSAVWDARTNQIFIQDIPSRLEEARRILAKTDIPVRQVLIEARIVEASDQFSRTLGFRLGINQVTPSTLSGTNYQYVAGGGLSDTAWTAGQIDPNQKPDFFQNTTSVNLPAARTSTGAQPGQFSVVLFNQSLTRFLNLELTALESDGKGKIISSPRVVTANQIEALIEQGTELPYLQASASGATSVSFRKANLALKVKPQITPDGNVNMDVEINKDAVGQQTVAGFSIDTKHVKTSVLVENGGTVVIGGIYTQEERTTINKIPLLGDLPLIGFLFRNSLKVDNKTELLVFLTPRIVDDRVTLR